MNVPAPIKIIPAIISIKNTQEHTKVELESVLLTEKSMPLQNINWLDGEFCFLKVFLWTRSWPTVFITQFKSL